MALPGLQAQPWKDRANNLAESYFSCFRRMQYGQGHKFGNLCLASYANEAAYREDTRRESNGAIFMDIVKKCARTRAHHDWCGYWQGNRRTEERQTGRSDELRDAEEAAVWAGLLAVSGGLEKCPPTAN